jgi:hypothetical protein
LVEILNKNKENKVARWESKRGKFLKDLTEVLDKQEIPPIVSAKEHDDLNKKYVDALEEIQQFVEKVENQKALIGKLKNVKDVDKVEEVIFESLKDENQKLDKLIKATKQFLKDLPPIVGEALYYENKGDSLPDSSYGENGRNDDIRDAIDKDFLEDRSEIIYVNQKDPKVKKAMKALSSLKDYIEELEFDSKGFFEAYAEQHSHQLKLSSKTFWQKNLF